jgi:uncharacterized protein YbbC (DUF1343 family)
MRFHIGFATLESTVVARMPGARSILGHPILRLLMLPALWAPSPSRADPGGSMIPRIAPPERVMLGIDVLESEGFGPLRGKRLALLTHRAGVDGLGRSTIDVLRGAPGIRLVSLFATENGLTGTTTSGKIFGDFRDPRTGLMVYSLYNGRTHQPTASQLRGIDALVVDLQDIGSRSYTFTGAMKQAMEGCFLNHVEVVVLDRPNPLGGMKVDGPMLDPRWVGPNLVNEFPVPYVHGLTIGELARMARYEPGILRIPEAAREAGRLTVIPMRGWRRRMRWPETGLAWVPTSPFIPNFAAVEGYPMVGLGCIFGEPPYAGGFSHGIGNQYPFRGLSNRYVKPEVLEKDLSALNLPGLRFRRVSVPSPRSGKPATGIFIEITDWDEWRPAELNFYLMQLDCRYSPRNPFAAASRPLVEGFLRHMGSTAFFEDLASRGARVDVAAYVSAWEAQDRAFRERSRRYWLYTE